MGLSKIEIERYSRHLSLEKVGYAGQEKLKSAKVLVVGAGGLGCPILQYLVAAGVGELGIVDFDKVEESNLQRQVLFNSDIVGTNKALSAKIQLEKLNSFVKLKAYPKKLTAENAVSLFKLYDFIIDGTDNFTTRYLVNDAAVLSKKPFIYGAIYRFEGQLSVFNYQNGPTYRCLFPNPSQLLAEANCSEAGVLGVLPGIIGTYMANEAIKIILGIGNVLSGKLMLINTLNNTTSTININPLKEEIAKVHEFGISTSQQDYVCDSDHPVKEISVVELRERLARKENIQFLDIREAHELPKPNELQGLSIPFAELPERHLEVSKSKLTVVYCQSGIRSKQAIHFLQEKHAHKMLLNLKGGINSWLEEANLLEKQI